jgi:hypothetical protein
MRKPSKSIVDEEVDNPLQAGRAGLGSSRSWRWPAWQALQRVPVPWCWSGSQGGFAQPSGRASFRVLIVAFMPATRRLRFFAFAARFTRSLRAAIRLSICAIRASGARIQRRFGALAAASRPPSADTATRRQRDPRRQCPNPRRRAGRAPAPATCAPDRCTCRTRAASGTLPTRAAACTSHTGPIVEVAVHPLPAGLPVVLRRDQRAPSRWRTPRRSDGRRHVSPTCSGRRTGRECSLSLQPRGSGAPGLVRRRQPGRAPGTPTPCRFGLVRPTARTTVRRNPSRCRPAVATSWSPSSSMGRTTCRSWRHSGKNWPANVSQSPSFIARRRLVADAVEVVLIARVDFRVVGDFRGMNRTVRPWSSTVCALTVFGGDIPVFHRAVADAARVGARADADHRQIDP